MLTKLDGTLIYSSGFSIASIGSPADIEPNKGIDTELLFSLKPTTFLVRLLITSIALALCFNLLIYPLCSKLVISL